MPKSFAQALRIQTSSVNADDTQVAKAQQEMESTVKTETTTEMSTQSTTKTEKKKTSRKKKR